MTIPTKGNQRPPSGGRKFSLWPAVLVFDGLMPSFVGLAPFLGAILIPIFVAAWLLLIFVIVTHRRERRQAKLRQLAERKRQRVSQEIQNLYQEQASPTDAKPATMLALATNQSEPTKVPVGALSTATIKFCPQCMREFRTALNRCPFDSEVLLPKPARSNSKVMDDLLDTRRSVMRCEKCARYYDLGAKYCLEDGSVLVSHEEEDYELEPYEGSLKCPECETVFDEDTVFCPEDGSRLMPTEHEMVTRPPASLPIALCTACLKEYPLSTTSCPEDGQPLLLLIGRTTGGLPVHGTGPKNKVCATCGQRFSDEALYCSLDGTKLLLMN